LYGRPRLRSSRSTLCFTDGFYSRTLSLSETHQRRCQPTLLGHSIVFAEWRQQHKSGLPHFGTRSIIYSLLPRQGRYHLESISQGPTSWSRGQSPLSISNNKRNSLWSFSPTSELKIFRDSTLANVVDRRPTTVACRSHLSHSASSFVYSTMTTGCDATRRAVYWCQPRLVQYIWTSNCSPKTNLI